VDLPQNAHQGRPITFPVQSGAGENYRNCKIGPRQRPQRQSRTRMGRGLEHFSRHFSKPNCISAFFERVLWTSSGRPARTPCKQFPAQRKGYALRGSLRLRQRVHPMRNLAVVFGKCRMMSPAPRLPRPARVRGQGTSTGFGHRHDFFGSHMVSFNAAGKMAREQGGQGNAGRGAWGPYSLEP